MSTGCLNRPAQRNALDRALTAAPRPIDVLAARVDGQEPHWVLNIASAGISGRVDELVKRSEPRRADPFDLAPPLGGAAPPPVAGTDPEPEDEDTGPVSPDSRR